MKKLLPIILFLTGTISSFSQIDSVKISKLQIGLILSPDYAFRQLHNNNGTALSNTIISAYNKIDRAKFGYTAGINLCYNLTNCLGLEFGAQFSNKGFATNLTDLTFGTLPSRGFTSSTTSLLTSAYFIYNYIYIDIPVKANFTFGKKKLRIISSVGLTSSIFISEQTTAVLHYADGSNTRNKSNKNTAYKPLNLSPTLSFGIDYKLSKKINLRIEPTLRYGIIKITDSPVTAYLWNAGLSCGLYMKL